MSSVKINYKLRVKQGTRAKLKKYADKVYNELDKNFRSAFGSGKWTDYSNREGSGSPPSRPNFNGMPDTKYTSQLLEIYSDAMGDRYARLGRALDRLYNSYTRERKRAIKRDLIAEGAITSYGFRVLEEDTGFLSGNFYNTTVEDLQRNGGRAISISNLFLFSQIQVYAEDFGLDLNPDGSSSGKPYVLEFLSLLQDRQILKAASNSEQDLWNAYFRIPKYRLKQMGSLYAKAARDFRRMAVKTLRTTKMGD